MDKYKAVKTVLMLASILLAAGTLLAAFLGVRELSYYVVRQDYSYKDYYAGHIREGCYGDLVDVTVSDNYAGEKYSAETQEQRDLGAYFLYTSLSKAYEKDGQTDKAAYYEAIASGYEAGITQYDPEKEDMVEKIDAALQSRS